MNTFRVDGIESIARIVDKIDLDLVQIDIGALKYSGAIPIVLKYALWATKQFGNIEIINIGDENPNNSPYRITANMVRQWVFKFIGPHTRIVSFGDEAIVLERTSALLDHTWSAGVVFSGEAKEVSVLEECLRGLGAQPELRAERGGEILVCGPASADKAFLSKFPDVKYLPYDGEGGPRFAIGAKKNALMRAMSGYKMAVLHARIVMEPGALSRTRREFDILAPNTRVLIRGSLQPYLSLAAIDRPLPGKVPRRLTVTLRDVRDHDPLKLHLGDRVPYVDGGAFFTTRRVFQQCPLDESIAWGEAEDVEWCVRALVNGFVSDLAPECKAISQTSKWRTWPSVGPIVPLARLLFRSARVASSKLNYIIQILRRL